MTSGAALAPDQRVSKNFTFRVKGEESPRTKKKRSRKPDPESDDESESENGPVYGMLSQPANRRLDLRPTVPVSAYSPGLRPIVLVSDLYLHSSCTRSERLVT